MPQRSTHPCSPTWSQPRDITSNGMRSPDTPPFKPAPRTLRGRCRSTVPAARRRRVHRTRPGDLLIEFNPATLVELPSGKRPNARVWTAAAVKHWKTTGQRPSPVMVWNPEQAGQFLGYAEDHDIALYPLYALMLHRGLRRGEAIGLRDLDLDTGTAVISQQITTVGYQPVTKKVKSEAGGHHGVVVVGRILVEILAGGARRRTDHLGLVALDLLASLAGADRHPVVDGDRVAGTRDHHTILLAATPSATSSARTRPASSRAPRDSASSKASPRRPSPVRGSPACFKSNTENRWYLFIEEHGGQGYVPFTTTDLDSGKWTKVTSSYSLPRNARHRIVLPITQAEYDRLHTAYQPNPLVVSVDPSR
jgi:hypothetical protein